MREKEILDINFQIFRSRSYRYNLVPLQRCSSREMDHNQREATSGSNLERQRDLLYLLCVCLRLCAIYIFYRVKCKFKRTRIHVSTFLLQHVIVRIFYVWNRLLVLYCLLNYMPRFLQCRKGHAYPLH